jgi:membrane-associated phospholipid phosphatase
MDLYLLIDGIGFFAPVILFGLSCLLLRHMSSYLKFYLVGTVLNNILNILLKLAIKEPRPSKDQKFIEIGVTNGAIISFDKFGMPSGHAQNCSFSLAFITFVFNNPFITTIYLIISLISIMQRYMYNNHTVLQLIIGFIIGLIAGYLTYLFGSKHIMGNIKTKKDDYFYN